MFWFQPEVQYISCYNTWTLYSIILYRGFSLMPHRNILFEPLSFNNKSNLQKNTLCPWVVSELHQFLVFLRLVGDPWHFGADPTFFFSDLADAKKITFFPYFFLITYPQTHWYQSLNRCFKDKFCVKILFFKHYFSPLNTFMRKRKDPDPGGPKTCGSGSPTLVSFRNINYTVDM